MGFPRSRAAAAVAGLLLLGLYARSQAVSARHGFPVYDERDYLRLARGVSGRGGVLAYARDHLTGTEREDNRHPLFIALLSPLMAGDAGDFARAKLAALACAAFFVLASGAAGFRAGRSLDSALAAAGWAALSPSVAVYAQTVAPDLLFAGLFALAVSLAGGAGERARPWFGFGLLAGLAWLTKGNGHFLLLVPAAAALRRGRQAWRHPAPPAAVCGFIAAGGLLLYRNILVWGNPFHHLLNKVIWLEDGNGFLPLMLTPEWDRVGPAWYWARFSAGQMASHAAHGLGAAAAGLLQAMASGPSGEPAGLAAGAVLLALSLLGLRRGWAAGERAAPWAAAAAVVPLWLAFAWGTKTGPAYVRFYLPMAAALVPWAVGEVRARAPARLGAGAGRGLLCAAALALLAADGRALFLNPLRAWSVPPFWAPTSAWLRAHAGGGYLADYMSIYSNWDAPPEVRRDAPLRRPAADVLAAARRLGARFAVVDLSLSAFDPYPEKFGPSDASGPTAFAGWPRCFKAEVAPNPLVVFGERCPGRGAP